MIFRKPYAFLIKNFRKIHVVLFALWVFILYKTLQLNGFVREFITYVSYDPYLEPITQYTSIILYLAVILMIAITTVLLLLLRKKKKPWLLYVIPVLTYLFLLFVFISVHNYFGTYEGGTSTATARAFRDLLNIGTIPQYITVVILAIRIIGVDLKRFSFGNDEEFLELGQEDREEVELSIDFDKGIFKRQYKKLIRTLKYFYEEHKFMVNLLSTILIIFIVGYSISYFMSHKTVKEDQSLDANGYIITVNQSFYTNKDKKGNILEKDSGFVIINLTVKNNSNKRSMDMSNFHLVNGKKDITYANSTYSKYFDDIGKEYDPREFETGEERTFALVFKVDKNLDKDHFVLYYQQYKSYNNVYLRKIKMNLEDVSSITKNPIKNIGEKITFSYPNGVKSNVTFEAVQILDKTSYKKEHCDEDDNCTISTFDLLPPVNQKILQINFTSGDFEGEELIDFSINYGKIKYIDNENITRELEIVDAMENKEYLGKYLYINVPTTLDVAKSIELIYTVRNQQYGYKIR